MAIKFGIDIWHPQRKISNFCWSDISFNATIKPKVSLVEQDISKSIRQFVIQVIDHICDPERMTSFRFGHAMSFSQAPASDHVSTPRAHTNKILYLIIYKADGIKG